jgi:hypothetical protein
MGTLELVCSPFVVCLNHIAETEVSELPFVDRPDFLEEACNLKCACLDTHLTSLDTHLTRPDDT